MTRPDVVIVDDDADHVMIIRTVIARLFSGVRVLTLTDPAAAEARIVREAPPGALVLIDRQLGNVDSFALVPAAARSRPDLTFIMMSTVADPEDRRRAVAAGARAFEEKPVTLAGWRDLVQRLATLASPAARSSA